MERRFCIHIFKFLVALLTTVICLILTVVLLFLNEFIAAVFFGLIAALFTFVGLLYGSHLTINTVGVQRDFGPLFKKNYRWDEISEVGVVGVNIFNNNDPNHTGSRYIYFSPDSLDEDQRFRLALKWPPKDILYMAYSKERLAFVQSLWKLPIETYNAGELIF